LLEERPLIPHTHHTAALAQLGQRQAPISADHTPGLLLVLAHSGLQRQTQIGARGQPQRHHLHGLSASSSALPWSLSRQQEGAPWGGALAPVAAVISSHQGLPVGCLCFTHDLSGAGREGMGITSLGRDARGLTFSAVIPARVMQPEVSTRGKQNWRIALCCYGMTFTPRHRFHLLCVASLVHLRSAHRLG